MIKSAQKFIHENVSKCTHNITGNLITKTVPYTLLFLLPFLSITVQDQECLVEEVNTLYSPDLVGLME